MSTSTHPRDLPPRQLILLLHRQVRLLRELAAQISAAAASPSQDDLVSATRLAYRLVYAEDLVGDDLDSEPCEPLIPGLDGRSQSELVELVQDISWMTLDLAQHLAFTSEFLREDLRPDAFIKAGQMAAELADYPLADLRDPDRVTPGVAVFGANGLENWTR